MNAANVIRRKEMKRPNKLLTSNQLMTCHMMAASCSSLREVRSDCGISLVITIFIEILTIPNLY